MSAFINLYNIIINKSFDNPNNDWLNKLANILFLINLVYLLYSTSQTEHFSDTYFLITLKTLFVCTSRLLPYCQCRVPQWIGTCLDKSTFKTCPIDKITFSHIA